MIQGGFDKREFEALFEATFDDLMAFVYSYVREREAARDVVHDAFFTLWEQRGMVDVSRSPKAFLYKMARNGALNHLRHRKVVASNEVQLACSLKDAGREMARYENALARLSAHVSELPERQRRALVGCFVEGKGYKEVAEELGVSVNTVKTHLQRAMKFLRGLTRDEIFLIFFLKKNAAACHPFA
ncbi:MAG: RNA polymerase sigma-70 factor [Odoribacteraceae bacterium]|jgi:RNA polymerase sigma-70 factor (ECF subfamily)|nr:RNA polymerase sigma-70 factor [Odoribacteraceae bacterium]